MKPGFLFGLGSFFIIGVITGLLRLREDVLTGAVAALICIPLSVMVIRAARSAPPHFLRLHAILGWFIGFNASFLVIIAASFVIWLLYIPAATVTALRDHPADIDTRRVRKVQTPGPQTGEREEKFSDPFLDFARRSAVRRAEMGSCRDSIRI